MTWRTQAMVLTLLGAVGLKLVLSNTYLYYINAWMKWPELATAAVLLALSVRYLFDGKDEPAGDHTAVPRSAWLLLLPIVVVFAISPPALGAYVAERRVNTAVPTPADSGAIPPLPHGDLLPMKVIEFVSRAQWDKRDSLKGRRVALTGFVSKDKQGHWYVTRLTIACCAADAIAWRVRVNGLEAPHRDRWVRVTGQWQDPRTKVPRRGTQNLLADGLRFVKQPKHPYA